MSLRFLRLASLYLVVTSLKLHALEERAQPTPFSEVCNEISSVISSASEVFFPGVSIFFIKPYHAERTFHAGEPLYEKGIYHLATSSTQQSACVVEAGSPEDVGIIVSDSYIYIIFRFLKIRFLSSFAYLEAPRHRSL